jgi:hypothetical protein
MGKKGWLFLVLGEIVELRRERIELFGAVSWCCFLG